MAWPLLLMNQHKAAEAYVQLAIQGASAEDAEIQSEVTALQAQAAMERGDLPGAVELARQALDRCRDKLRQLTRRTRSGKLEEVIQNVNEYAMGWIGYFRLADTPSVFAELDEWLRQRLRQLVWKRWKRGRTRYRELVGMGVPPSRAAGGAGGTSPWRMAATPVINEALNNAYWQKQGLRSIAERYHQLRCA